MGIILTARGVTKRFGGLTALSAVDFDLTEGTIASIIGPNGAGKTTFFNVFTGIYVPEEGTVTFGETPILGKRPDQMFSPCVELSSDRPSLSANADEHHEVIPDPLSYQAGSHWFQGNFPRFGT